MWFFAASGYSKAAVEYADRTGMLLFVYDNLGRLEPVNDHAISKLKTAPRMVPRGGITQIGGVSGPAVSGQ
jgi:hypothetical protein